MNNPLIANADHFVSFHLLNYTTIRILLSSIVYQRIELTSSGDIQLFSLSYAK